MIPEIDDETRAAIQEGLAQARRGEFVSEEEIEEVWNRYGAFQSTSEQLAEVRRRRAGKKPVKLTLQEVDERLRRRGV